MAARLDRADDLAREDPAQLRVAELVHESHASAVPACTSTTSPCDTGSTSAISTELRRPAPSSHSARDRLASTRSTRISTASSEHVMQ
jgi:hypothetical protein